MAGVKAEHLVIGGRGRIGREVLRALTAQGFEARSLARSPSQSGTQAGVEEVAGDLGDRASLEAAMRGVRSVFFITPHDPREEQLGSNVVAAAQAAGVRRLVFASAYHAELPNPVAFSMFVSAMGLVTHYGPKLRVERRVRRSGLSPVVLMPTNFFQNDALFLDEIRAGRYPQPLGDRGVNRVDCRDIGDAAARALLDDAIPAGAYPLVGADTALTGRECAEVWARELGQPVAYDGDLNRWWELMSTRMHAREREDFAKTYKIFGRVRVAASDADHKRVTGLLGRPPRAYADYVRECAQS